MFKVVRKNGILIAYGPNNNNYQPNIKSGEVLSTETIEPSYLEKSENGSMVIDDVYSNLTKEQYILEVNNLAEKERGKLVILGAGKSQSYRLKQAEVVLYKFNIDNSNSIVDTDYPWMKSRADRLSIPVVDVYNEWTILISAWQTAAISIENIEEQSIEDIKNVINDVTLDETLRNLINNITW